MHQSQPGAEWVWNGGSSRQGSCGLPEAQSSSIPWGVLSRVDVSVPGCMPEHSLLVYSSPRTASVAIDSQRSQDDSRCCFLPQHRYSQPYLSPFPWLLLTKGRPPALPCALLALLLPLFPFPHFPSPPQSGEGWTHLVCSFNKDF